MAFMTNVLPTDSAYYTLSHASLTNGKLEIEAGGSAEIDLDVSILNEVTDSLMIVLFPSIATDNYIPRARATLFLRSDATEAALCCFPTSSPSGAASAVFDIDAGDGSYTSAKLIIESSEIITMLAWWLNPEYSASIDETVINGVKEAIPSLLYDYNTWPLTIGQVEESVGVITGYLGANTDMQGHFSMNFVASEQCCVIVRFKDNNYTELYAPFIFTVSSGSNTVSVPHAYIDRLAGSHSFMATCQCTNGLLTMHPRDVLYTIDGGHLLSRLMDVSIDVLDVALRQLNADDGPDEIWVVGIEAEELLVQSRDYDNANSATSWTPQYSLGHAIDAAIVFDGDWVRPTGEERFTIETSRYPLVFAVTDVGNLYVYDAGDIASRVLLDTGVSSVKAVRGFKSQIYLAQDQGVLCTYIKNGTVYYRQYMYITNVYTWNSPAEVPLVLQTGEEILHQHPHRLNDYRVGILVSTNQRNVWFISDRTYVAQAMKTHSETLEPSLTGMVMPNNPLFVSDATFEEFELHENIQTINMTYPGTLVGQLVYDSTSQTYDGISILVRGVWAKHDITIIGNVLQIHFYELVDWQDDHSADATIDISIDASLLKVKSDPDNDWCTIYTVAQSIQYVIARDTITYKVLADEEQIITPTQSGSIVSKSIVSNHCETTDELQLVPTIVGSALSKNIISTTAFTEDTKSMTPTLSTTTTYILLSPVGEEPI